MSTILRLLRRWFGYPVDGYALLREGRYVYIGSQKVLMFDRALSLVERAALRDAIENGWPPLVRPLPPPPLAPPWRDPGTTR